MAVGADFPSLFNGFNRQTVFALAGDFPRGRPAPRQSPADFAGGSGTTCFHLPPSAPPSLPVQDSTAASLADRGAEPCPARAHHLLIDVLVFFLPMARHKDWGFANEQIWIRFPVIACVYPRQYTELNRSLNLGNAKD